MLAEEDLGVTGRIMKAARDTIVFDLHARAKNRQFSSVFRESLQERIRGLRNP